MSFILRSVYADRTEQNKSLGAEYQFIHRELNYDEFAKMFNAVYERSHVNDGDELADKHTKNVYAFVIFDGGKTIPLFKDMQYYIMSDTGKTFDKLSYR